MLDLTLLQWIYARTFVCSTLHGDMNACQKCTIFALFG